MKRTPIPNPENNPNDKKAMTDLDKYYNNLLSFLEDFGYIDTEHTFFQNLNSLQYLPIILAITTFTYIKKYYEYDTHLYLWFRKY